MPGTQPDMESTPGPDDGIPDDAGSGWSWRWLIPLAGIITVAVLLWLIFLPPDTTDAATEALCISTAQLSVTIEAVPAVTPDTPVEEMTTWLPAAGEDVAAEHRAVVRRFRTGIDAWRRGVQERFPAPGV